MARTVRGLGSKASAGREVSVHATRDVPCLVAALGLSIAAALSACTPAPAASPSAAPAPPARAEPPAPAPPAAVQAAPTAPAAANRSGPAPLSPPVPVKVGDAGTVAHRGIYIGLERGYFADEGLEV